MKYKKVILIIVVTMLFASVLVMFTDNLLSRKILVFASELIGAKDFEDNCNSLKTYSEVEEVILKNKFVLNDKEFSLKDYIQKEPLDIRGNICQNKAILKFDVDTSKENKEIKKEIGEDFYGVKYRVNLM